jgi:hypothetical protein
MWISKWCCCSTYSTMDANISKQELEYFALHMPKEEWKKLANVVHFNETRDFPALPWFLSFCFGKDPPIETIVDKCRHLTNENVNTSLQNFSIPYAHLRKFKEYLTDVSKARIALNEEKLDTILWYYEELQCLDVDDIIGQRLRKGDQITLSYGKIMERLLFFRKLREGERNASKSDDSQSSDNATTIPRSSDEPTHANKAQFYFDLSDIAQAQLKKIKLSVESPVAVLGDASRSMGVAFRTAHVLSSLLTTICSAKLTFFNEKMFLPAKHPETIEDVLQLASETLVGRKSAPAAALVPYYDSKEVIKTFVLVSDEKENTSARSNSGEKWRFFQLLKKYREEVYPAKLIFVSFINEQHEKKGIYSRFREANIPDVLQVRENEQR